MLKLSEISKKPKDQLKVAVFCFVFGKTQQRHSLFKPNIAVLRKMERRLNFDIVSLSHCRC